MADRGKARFVDGFTTLRAAQRHSVEKRYATRPPPKPAAEEAKPSDKPSARKTGVGIGRTVMPTRFEIVCYSCSYAFVMRGRAESTQCPKCGARLGLKDETIAGTFSDELITAGKVRLTADAVVTGGKIIANDVILEGTVQGGSLRAFKTLELHATAVIPPELVDAQHLHIGEGASFDFPDEKAFHDIEILGELKADLTAGGQVTVRATGHLRGTLRATHFTVEEGAGVNADLVIAPPAPEEADEEGPGA